MMQALTRFLRKLPRIGRWIWTERTTAAVAALGFFVTLYLYLAKPAWFDDGLAGNLLSEAIGILFAVILLQSLIDTRDQRRTRAARFGAYSESTWIYNNIRQRWATLVQATITEPPMLGDDLFSDKYLDEVSAHLDERQSLFPGATGPWHQEQLKWRKDIVKRIDQVIQRYQAHLDSELLSVLLQIERTAGFAVLDFYLPSALSQHDVKLYRSFHSTLMRLAPEFTHLSGFFRPADITFADVVESMRSDAAANRAVFGSLRFQEKNSGA